MITYNELKEKCTCWKGYKRVPGTKPCAEDSCMKEEKDTGGHGSEKHHAMAFGRMNPITSGHEAVVNKLHSVAKEHGASHSLIVSHSQDAKKNPLTGAQKVAHAKNAFPGTNVSSASKESPTILHHAAAAHKAGATHLHVVAGSDRHEEMHNLLHKYNGKDSGHGHYNFKKITVHSSGERDPDAEGTTGISASKMREHAASGNKAEFHKGAPSKMKPEHKDAMYNDVRKGMNIKEETVQETLRPEMGAATYINDFISSTNPKFNNKSKEERRKMAIGAYMAAKAKGVKEEVQIDELSTDLLGRYKTAAHADAKAADASGNYAKGDKRFKGINKATNKQFDNDLKKHGQMKEGTLQGNIGGGDAMNTTTSAPSASTAKDTTMSKKIKGFKFFNGENDRQMNMNQPVKEGMMDTVKKVAKKAAEVLGGPDDEGHKKDLQKKMGIPQTGKPAMAKQNEEFGEGYQSFSGRSHGHAYGGGGFGKREREDDEGYSNEKKPMYPANNPTNTPKKPQKPEVKEAKDEKEYGYEGDMAMNQLKTLVRCAEMIEDCLKPDTDLPEWVQSKITLATDYIQTAADYLYSESEVNEETLDEKSIQARRNKTYKNLMAASKGARVNQDLGMTPADTGHKNKQQMNKAIGRAVSRGEVHEATTGNPGHGYHGQHQSTHDADAAYKTIHAHVKSLTDSDDTTVKHYLDSAHGRHLVGHENDHDHIKKDFKKFAKYYKPEMHEATAQKGVNVDKVNAAGEEPHEEKFETFKKTKQKVKEDNMKSYKEFLQSLDEKLIGKQHKIDKNHNGKVDAQDFKMLRKEEVEELDEIKMSELPSRSIKGKSYGASYEDPEGAFETKDDMKKPAKAAGRKTGQRTGSYKPRATMSKLKAAGSTYK